MISAVSLHPFISHFPIALYVAGLGLIILARVKEHPAYVNAAAFNLSIGLLTAILANFTGMVSTDLELRTTVEVEGHQGYSFLFTILYGFSTGYSYTKVYSSTAVMFYVFGLFALCASAYSGYALVF